jgi:hypothetical protein
MLTDPSQSMAAGTVKFGSASTPTPGSVSDGAFVTAVVVGDFVEGSFVGVVASDGTDVSVSYTGGVNGGTMGGGTGCG